MFFHTHKYSSELTFSDIFSILNVFSITFRQPYDFEFFNRKYLANPFGDSIHVLSYDSSHNLVATRALWRLDSNLYYQCVDTAVHPHYQGKGLFKESTEYMIKSLPDLYFYNKPNSNSLRQYLKYGWKIDKQQYLACASRLNTRFLSSIPLLGWSQSQLVWRMSLTNNNTYSQFLYNGLHYVSTTKRKFFNMLLFKTPHLLDIPKSSSCIFFSFDARSFIRFPYSQTLLSRCHHSFVPPSFYFDMT